MEGKLPEADGNEQADGKEQADGNVKSSMQRKLKILMTNEKLSLE